MGPKRTDNEIIEALHGESDEAALEDYPLDVAQQELRDAGADPAEIGAWGASLVDELKKKRRLAWQEEARAKIQKVRSLDAKRAERAPVGGLSRGELLARIERAQQDPRLGGELAIAARNLEIIGEASDEALREELDQLETLAELSEMLRALP